MRIEPIRFKTDSAESRVCIKCGVEKDLDQFAKDKKGKYGRRSQCRDCERAGNTKRVMGWKRRNPDRVKAARAQYSNSHQEVIRANSKRNKPIYYKKNRESILARAAVKRRQFRIENPLPPKIVQTAEEIKKGLKSYNQRQSAMLTDGYVKKQIVKRMPGVSRADIPADLVKLKRDMLLLKRSRKNGVT